MATEVTKLEQIDESSVEEQQSILTQFIQEKYPDIDVSKGVLHDLVQYLNAVYAAKEQKELENWKNCRSLLAITENPTIANADSVDNILSNYNVERRHGTKAIGTIMLEFTEDASTIIPVGTTFNYNDIEFITNVSYLIYSSDSPNSNVADRVLVQLSDGNYGCVIDVTATDIGVDGCIKKNTVLQVSNIANLFVAYAYDDFYGGTDDEDNVSLINRLKEGIATPCWGNRSNIKSTIVNNSNLEGIVDISVIGFDDPEMQRDQISLFPISTGGKIDIYAKTAPYTITKTTTITATITDIDVDYAYWQSTISADILPGMWRVTEVKPQNASKYADNLELVAQYVESTNSDLTVLDACFTKYQDIVIKFKTKVEDGQSTGQSDKFDISCIGVPSITAVQELCDDRNIVPVAADVLVKAAVPYIIAVEVKIRQSKNNPITEADITNIKSTLASKINNMGFTGVLTTAELAASIKHLLDTGQVIAYIQLSGTILGPNNVLYREATNKQLVVPDMPLNYISKNTTTFFSDVSYIDVVTECFDE